MTTHLHGGEFAVDPTPTAEIDRLEAVFEPLATAVRDLVDATIRTTVEDDEVGLVAKEVAALVARLQASQLPGPAGVRFNTEGRSWNWGNAVVGRRNALAPPVVTVHDLPNRSAHADVELGAAYEGPPGMVHGGVAALLLDQLMGETASGFTKVTMTGTLTLRYLRATPLGPLRLEAHVASDVGRKVVVKAHIGDAAGPTVEAEGLFIVPRWAV